MQNREGTEFCYFLRRELSTISKKRSGRKLTTDMLIDRGILKNRSKALSLVYLHTRNRCATAAIGVNFFLWGKGQGERRGDRNI